MEKAATMKRRPLSEILFSVASPEAIHMIESLLRFNPNQRLTAHAALRHAYVARFHNSAQVPDNQAQGTEQLVENIVHPAFETHPSYIHYCIQMYNSSSLS